MPTCVASEGRSVDCDLLDICQTPTLLKVYFKSLNNRLNDAAARRKKEVGIRVRLRSSSVLLLTPWRRIWR